MKIKIILTAIKEYNADPEDFEIIKESILDDPLLFIDDLDTELRVNIL